MKIEWWVEYGYVGKSRTHTLEIPDEELVELNAEDQEMYIHECVDEEMRQHVYAGWRVVE